MSGGHVPQDVLLGQNVLTEPNVSTCELCALLLRLAGKDK